MVIGSSKIEIWDIVKFMKENDGENQRAWDEYKLLIGDLVEHKASGERGIITMFESYRASDFLISKKKWLSVTIARGFDGLVCDVPISHVRKVND